MVCYQETFTFTYIVIQLVGVAEHINVCCPVPWCAEVETPELTCPNKHTILCVCVSSLLGNNLQALPMLRSENTSRRNCACMCVCVCCAGVCVCCAGVCVVCV